MPVNPSLRNQLLGMQAEDGRVRQRLAAEGKLEEGYHPLMEAVHRENAASLRQIIARYGWPGKSLAGEDGAEAAWLVLQHSIGDPDLQRGCLPLLQSAVTAGEIPAWQVAYLEDRIAYFEGRPQRYGTQLTWDDDGYTVPWNLEDPQGVDEFRRSVGLPPMVEQLVPRAEQTPVEREQVRRKRASGSTWARQAGWRNDSGG